MKIFAIHFGAFSDAKRSILMSMLRININPIDSKTINDMILAPKNASSSFKIICADFSLLSKTHNLLVTYAKRTATIQAINVEISSNVILKIWLKNENSAMELLPSTLSAKKKVIKLTIVVNTPNKRYDNISYVRSFPITGIVRNFLKKANEKILSYKAFKIFIS